MPAAGVALIAIPTATLVFGWYSYARTNDRSRFMLGSLIVMSVSLLLLLSVFNKESVLGSAGSTRRVALSISNAIICPASCMLAALHRSLRVSAIVACVTITSCWLLLWVGSAAF